MSFGFEKCYCLSELSIKLALTEFNFEISTWASEIVCYYAPVSLVLSLNSLQQNRHHLFVFSGKRWKLRGARESNTKIGEEEHESWITLWKRRMVFLLRCISCECLALRARLVFPPPAWKCITYNDASSAGLRENGMLFFILLLFFFKVGLCPWGIWKGVIWKWCRQHQWLHNQLNEENTSACQCWNNKYCFRTYNLRARRYSLTWSRCKGT